VKKCLILIVIILLIFGIENIGTLYGSKTLNQYVRAFFYSTSLKSFSINDQQFREMNYTDIDAGEYLQFKYTRTYRDNNHNVYGKEGLDDFYNIVMNFVINTAYRFSLGYHIPKPRVISSNYLVGAYYWISWDTAKVLTSFMDWRDSIYMPILGKYDSTNTTVIDWHIKWAVEHGIEFFAVQFFESQLKKGFLRADFLPYIKFCFIAPVELSLDSDKDKFIHQIEWMMIYFNNPSYLRIDNRPVIFILIRQHFTQGEDTKLLLIFREAKNHMKSISVNPYLVGVYSISDGDYSKTYSSLTKEFDAITLYNMPTINGRLTSYDQMVDGYIKANRIWAEQVERIGVKYIPVVTPGFNDTLSYKHGTRNWLVVRGGTTPHKFRKMCEGVKECVDQRIKMIMIEAWNEFAEGSVIEPTIEYRFAYLEVVRDVFSYVLGSRMNISLVKQQSPVRGLVKVKIEINDSHFKEAMLLIDNMTVCTWFKTGSYIFKWDTTKYVDGAHALDLIVRDKLGNMAVRSLNVIIDNTAPVIESLITEPKEPIEGKEVTVLANVYDKTSGVKKVFLWYRLNEGEWNQVDMLSEKGLWKGVISAYSINTTIEYYIEAYDVAGNSAISQVYSYIVKTNPAIKPPSIKIKYPVANAVIKENIVKVVWEVKAGSYPIAEVKIKLDGGDWIDVTKLKNYTFTGVLEGYHTIIIKVIDESGKMIEESVKFKVEFTKAPILTELLAVSIIVLIIIIIFLKKKRMKELK